MLKIVYMEKILISILFNTWQSIDIWSKVEQVQMPNTCYGGGYYQKTWQYKQNFVQKVHFLYVILMICLSSHFWHLIFNFLGPLKYPLENGE